MPFGGMLSLGAAGLAGGSALAGLFGGTPTQNVPSYSYQNQGGADQGAFSGTQNLGQYNVGANLLPQYQQIAQNSVNNPYADMFQQGSGTAAGYGVGSGVNAYNAGGALTGSALSQIPNVQALISMGFDPQGALYAQQQNQNQQQNAAILGQSGVASTPYGAGVQQQANTNFNLGWEQQALQRASTAEQGAGSLMSSINSGVNTGQNLQAGAAGQILQGAGMPYNTFQGINANNLATLGQVGSFGQQAAQIPQEQIQDYLAYLSGGTQQQGANVNQQNSVFGQQQQLGSQLGGALAGIGKGWGTAFGGSSGGGGTGGFATNSWGQNNPGVAGSAFYGPAAP
jgi:hypothetical protein